MKKKIVMLFMVLITSVSLIAQVLESSLQQSNWPVIFDANWKVVTAPKAPAFYRDFKPFTDNNSGGSVRDYFISGKLQMDGTTSTNLKSANPDDYEKEGVFTWYYENGKIQIISFFRDNKLEGLRSVFSEDGELAEEATYKNDKIHGDYKSYHKGGKPWFVAKYSNGLLVDNFAEEYTESGERAGVYVENFVSAGNTYSWPMGDYSTYSAKIEPGTGLKLTNSDNNRLGFHLKKPTILSGQPFYYSCRVSSVSGNSGAYYGLSFDFKDWDNYKYFIISDNGNFTIGEYKNGTISTIVSATPSDAIKKRQELGGFYFDNVNDLEVVTQSGKTSFTINKVNVYSTQTFLAGTGMLGLYIVSGSKTVTFNQFIIKAK
jgi:hypothetical protein